MTKIDTLIQKMDSILFLLKEQSDNKKEILNVDEASTYLKMKHSCLYNLTSKSVIPFYKPHGKNIYFKRSELDDWILQNKHESNTDIQDKAIEFLASQKK